MNTEQQHQKARKEHQNRTLLFLMAEGIRQDSKQLCKEAAVAKEAAQDVVQMSRLRR